MGMEFYQILFEKYPFVLPIFGRADMDYLSLHLFQALEEIWVGGKPFKSLACDRKP